ncbi:MAG: Isonitrile hydratase [Stenotrophomonas maltophilia]|uniref:Isonitrile hydratase n=1 Tax=Stenotrophomonas maltophilia TaxID=40324 RepID=A0A7V8FDU7_STEMA|nr:MAG: Isonitrile hydratase [Stenotrophomonas maltophilia]
MRALPSLPSAPRSLQLLALPGFQLLDVAGPLDVFAQANRVLGKAAYALSVVSPGRGPVRSSSGLEVLAQRSVLDAGDASADTLLVAGGPEHAERRLDARTARWLAEHAPRARRHGAVCTGAFALGAPGLLDQPCRLTTHWAYAAQLAARHPAARIDADAIYVADRALRTSAGITAGMDLALALVEEDLGRAVARTVADDLVLFFRREGGQRQFARTDTGVEVADSGAPPPRAALQELQRWVATRLHERHSVASLAAQAGLSARSFARVFQAEMHCTPMVWLEQQRMEQARQRLEAGQAPKQVAAAVAFGSVDTLRLAFLRRFGVTPAAWRRRHAHKAGDGG